MGYQQLISPDTTVCENPGWCLGMATKVFFGAQGGYGCATDAWNASPTQNGSRDMPPVSVPVWFSWWGNIDGTYKDWGHVVVWVPGRGFLSSPGKWTDGYGQQWFGSLEEIERWFGCRYNGFTLDIMPNGSVAVLTDAPSPAPTPSPRPDWNGSYTVVAGDTLSGIAGNYGISWQDLYAANTDVIGGNPDAINPGMVLRVPGDAPAPAPAPTPSGTTYTVVVDDNLWNIATQFYGDGTRYTEIYEANKDLIGDNPSLIQPGMVLTIPGV